MKPFPTTLLFLLGIFTLPCRLLSQPPEFDLEAYRQFLQDHEDMTADELLSLYPAELFLENAGVSWALALYRDSMEIKYALTEHEKALLQKHGFMVSERLRRNSFVEHYLDIWREDLPVFISTDAILHAFHFYYVKLLQKMEKGALQPLLTELLTAMRQSLPALAARYAGQEDMAVMLRDADVYVAVPLRLLGENISPFYPENEAVVEEILGLIAAGEFATYPFFSETCKAIDFSQFRPRGHYAEDEALSRYFRAMMWLGRIEIYLLKPVSAPLYCPEQTDADIQRQDIDAALLIELMGLSNTLEQYRQIEGALSFLVGEPDNATPPQLQALIQSAGLGNAAGLLDGEILAAFQDSLRSQSIGMQRINSQVLAQDPFSTESLQPAAAFLLFGQRFILDSYIAANVVYSRVEYQGNLVCRLFPSTLDILFALGNDPAAQLLIPELEQYHYADNLAALRYLVDAYDENFWGSTVHSLWLNAIRALNPPQDREALPRFMQTGAWWQQKMNTQMASWAELRHDHLLYAKPSYTDAVICSYPSGYVEPIPAAFSNLNELAAKAHARFSGLPFSDEELQAEILGYFSLLQEITDKLAAIAEKELAGFPLDEDEQAFTKEILFQGEYGVLDGWYMKLLFGADYYPENIPFGGLDNPLSDYLVADYHTIPTDCAGSTMGWVAHAGTGPAGLAIVVARDNDGQLTAFAGPVMSYYEYTTTNFLRLTDQEWEEGYWQLAGRPDWVNVYLADENGQPKGPGGLIWTGTESPAQIRETALTAECFPNPFSPPAAIRFTIPYGMGYQPAELLVYGLQGQVVKRLLQGRLPAGTYIAQWDGTNESGKRMPPGSYFYEFRCGDQQVAGKMIMVGGRE